MVRPSNSRQSIQTDERQSIDLDEYFCDHNIYNSLNDVESDLLFSHSRYFEYQSTLCNREYSEMKSRVKERLRLHSIYITLYKTCQKIYFYQIRDYFFLTLSTRMRSLHTR